MDELKKMIVALGNSVSLLRSEMLGRFEEQDKKYDVSFNRLEKKIDGVESNLTKRIDKIGLQVAKLEDDAPTVKEFDKLEKRVSKVEHRVVSL